MRRLGLSIALLLASICSLAEDTVSTSYDAFFLEAMIQRQKGNNDAAFDLLRHCIKLNPQAAEAYYYLAQYYQILRNDSLANRYYLKAVELEPDNATFLETVGQMYISQQNYEKAISVVEQLYQQDKSREELLEMLFTLYQQTDNTDKLRPWSVWRPARGRANGCRMPRVISTPRWATNRQPLPR